MSIFGLHMTGNRESRDSQRYRKHIIRLLLTYVLPLIFLIVYFQVQYSAIIRERHLVHLRSIAENQAKTLDLFFRERAVNMTNLIDNPALAIPPSGDVIQTYLGRLQRESDAFVDIGFLNEEGVQTHYAGPVPSLGQRDYSSEEWYRSLSAAPERYVFTDIYLGFRKEPHLTLGMQRFHNGTAYTLRSAMDPKLIYEYITSLEDSSDVSISIINRNGVFQLVQPGAGTILAQSPFSPPRNPTTGAAKYRSDGNPSDFAYAWLHTADWAVIVQSASADRGYTLFGAQTNIIAASLLIVLIVSSIVVFRAKRLVEDEREKESAREQLEHASKLASVGELSAGIAHEINNPLAIIASETGLMKDLMNPEFGEETTFADLDPHIENIRDAVFRCRDITGKLLTFVRRTDFELKPYDLHAVIDEIVDGFLSHEMQTENIEVVKNYCNYDKPVETDGNKVRQVLLNIFNNSVDAITPPGKITFRTFTEYGFFCIEVSDTGTGIPPELMNRIFLPFFTTKEVGKGTGLGLSVSYGIIKNLRGRIDVTSVPGGGSRFIVRIPL